MSKANRLAGQSSPYLLQHRFNPVDWYPWGSAALKRARDEDRPILLSIGYSACHWCHVMERESFENDEIAALLNRHFVAIKIDREERPDLDEIYMNAIQLMTGAGGWPLNVFLTPKLEPFFGGTYFPPDSRHGRIGFGELLGRIAEQWSSRREGLEDAAARMTEQLRRIAEGQAGPEAAEGPDSPPGSAEISRAVADLAGRFDPRWGGFGHAPKFPPDGGLNLLLRQHARSGESVPLSMATRTLDGMAAGGMYDQLGGGFARYSVDESWLVPHFEKMLYNQALLVPLYVDAWLLTERAGYRRVVEETLDFVARELTAAEGGFFSSLDADSEGREGAYYVWSRDEIVKNLGPEAGERVCELYGVSRSGNFEGENALNLIDSVRTPTDEERRVATEKRIAGLAGERRKLLELRGRRERPATDDKVLTAWNGLMISACCRAHRAFERDGDLRMARRSAEFVQRHLRRDERLLVSCRKGKAGLNAYLDDYAFLGRGLLDLYEAGHDPGHLHLAAGLARSIQRHFEDPDRGGFYFVSDDHEKLLTRSRSSHDGALPSGAGVAVELLLRLAAHLDDRSFRESAAGALSSYGAEIRRAPAAYPALLAAAELTSEPWIEVAIVGDPEGPGTRALLRQVGRRYLPRLVLAVARTASEELPLLRGRTPDGALATAWVCRDHACRAPTTDPLELGRFLDEAASPDQT